MANFNRDNVEIAIPENVVPIVKGWLEKADSKIESLTKENSDHLNTVELLKKKLAEQQDSVTKISQALDVSQGKEQALLAEVELLKKQLADSTSDARIIERRQVERIALAASVVNADSLDTLSTKGLKEKVIAGRWGQSMIQGKNDDALDAMFEIAAKEISSQNTKKLASSSSQAHQDNMRALDEVVPITNDSLDSELEKVFVKTQADKQDAWKTFLKEVR